MKKLSVFLLLTAIFSLHAEVIFFRSGKIMAAETSSTAPAMDRIDDKITFPELPQNRLYAVISVKLDSGRKISIFDYSLESSGKTYPCVAINFNGKKFNYTESEISGADKILQLLFIIEKLPQPAGSLKLKCNLPPLDGTYDLQVPFTGTGYQRLTSPTDIPAAGLIRKNSK